jgi:YidC/Oxa1 family membrane protein insertase
LDSGSKEEETLQVTLLLGNILSPIAYLLGLIMNGIYEFFHLFGIQNLALTIFVFTFITKSLMLPLTIKQQKFTKLSSRMNPEIQKITAKYKGKKDEASLRKQQAETQAVYEKYGASPTSGCLPLLITLPIMFALFQVINNIPDYVTLVREQYNNVAEAVKGNPTVLQQLADMVKQTAANLSDNAKIVDALDKLKNVQWKEITAGLTSAKSSIDYINNVNYFFGLNIKSIPDWRTPAVIIPILSMALQFVQGKQVSVKSKDDKDNPTANAMSSMNVVMPIMSGFFCLMLPIGVGLYWIATSVFTIIQQFFVNKIMDRMDVDELIEKSRAKAAKRRKVLPQGASLQELAKKQTKYIENNVSDEAKGQKENNTNIEDENKDSSENKKDVSKNPSSISEIANLLKNRNSEKGDKQ